MPDAVHAMDVLYRVEKVPNRYPWVGAYKRTRIDDDWHTKDRHNQVDGYGPANLGEIYRAAGLHVPRPAGLEWLDEGADAVAAALANTPPEEVYTAFVERLRSQKLYDGHIAWCLRDGFDRFELRRSGSMLDRMMHGAHAASPQNGGKNALIS